MPEQVRKRGKLGNKLQRSLSPTNWKNKMEAELKNLLAILFNSMEYSYSYSLSLSLSIYLFHFLNFYLVFSLIFWNSITFEGRLGVLKVEKSCWIKQKSTKDCLERAINLSVQHFNSVARLINRCKLTLELSCNCPLTKFTK